MINPSGTNPQPQGTQDSLMIKGSDVGTGYDPVHKNISGLQKKGGVTHQ